MSSMSLTYSANFVLWKFSAIQQSESYIRYQPGLHTQLVAILQGIDTWSIHITPIDPFGTAFAPLPTRAHGPAHPTGACNCNDHCELQDLVMFQISYRPGRRKSVQPGYQAESSDYNFCVE
jgi:hypothetical protein